MGAGIGGDEGSGDEEAGGPPRESQGRLRDSTQGAKGEEDRDRVPYVSVARFSILDGHSFLFVVVRCLNRQLPFKRSGRCCTVC